MKIIKTKILNNLKWVTLKEKKYYDNHKNIKTWEYIERKSKTKAVIILAKTDKTDSIILIKQFRMPFEKYVFEFPAGLVDNDETIEAAAKRELLEETGYTGKVTEISPEICTTAGLSNETVYLVNMTVSETAEHLSSPDSSETLTTIKLSPVDYIDFLNQVKKDKNIIDGRVYIFLKTLAEK